MKTSRATRPVVGPGIVGEKVLGRNALRTRPENLEIPIRRGVEGKQIGVCPPAYVARIPHSIDPRETRRRTPSCDPAT